MVSDVSTSTIIPSMSSAVTVHPQQTTNGHSVPQGLASTTPQPPLHPHSQSHPNLPSGSPGTPVWQNPNPPLPRGRAPRDPLAVTTKLQCTSLQDMENKLRDYLDNPPAAPEHCTCELTLWAGASFLVKLDYVPPNLRNGQGQPDAGFLQAVADFNAQKPLQTTGDGRETTLSVLDALQQLNDPKETMKRQRAISKVCVAAVQKTDGYRYSFHNSWKSGEDNAYRFSYYCNDSLLNKDRVANGKSGSQGKRATKPVYDCKGVLSIKFSATKQCIDVVYRHIPCHESYEDRAPPPRKNSKRRAEWEAKHPDRVKVPKENESAEGTPTREPKQKRKKKDEPPKSAEAELREQSMFSLLELMRPDEPKKPEQMAATNTPVQVPPPQPSPVATTVGAQKTPSRRQPKSAIQCAICVSRRTKCDGAKPRCKTCGEKGWPCFYQAEGGQATTSGHTTPGVPQYGIPTPQMPPQPSPSLAESNTPVPLFETMHQTDIAALALANQNQDLQKEIANMRQERVNAQKEALDLKNQMADMRKMLESLQSEKAKPTTAQPSIQQPSLSQQSALPQQNTMNVGHERRTSSQQHHHVAGTPQQPSYNTHYNNNTPHIYHQPAPSQAAHTRAHAPSVYPTNNGASSTNTWGDGMYGAYQQSQQSNAMLPGAHQHMMQRYR